MKIELISKSKRERGQRKFMDLVKKNMKSLLHACKQPVWQKKKELHLLKYSRKNISYCVTVN